jgi:hypothetical protein
MPRMRTLLVVALGIGWSATGRADESEDHTKADVLFEEAQRLKQAGDTSAACNKYREALRYNPNAVGTLLNVGKCSEDSNQLATAIKHYTHARDLAREHSLTEHRAAAEERVSKIAPRVPRLAIAFMERPDNMKLVIDDVVYPTDIETTNELRLDPGTRHIVVTAPGRVPYETNVELVEGKQQAVAIPRLGFPVTLSGRRTAGKIATASGLALIGGGVVLGWLGSRRYHEQFTTGQCNMQRRCTEEGYRATVEGRQLGTVGTVVGAIGIAAFGVGAYLWLFAPTERREGVAIVPAVMPDMAGVTAIGRF